MNTQGKGLTQVEKVMLILRGIAKDIPIRQLCQQMHLSRQQYYNLRKRAMMGLEQAMQDNSPGRPSKDRVQDLKQAQEKIRGFRSQVNQLEKEQEKLKRKNLKLESEYAFAKRMIQYRIDDGRLPAGIFKKNGV